MNKKIWFPLTTSQSELLFAFEHSAGLSDLAEVMAKDPSVISRSLQKIAEEYPVLVKVKGRWEITALGRQLNLLAKELSDRQSSLLSANKIRREADYDFSDKESALVIVNAQVGLLDATQAGRNNLDAEKNIEKLIKFWRLKGRPIIHVKHVSDNPSSVFYRNSPGCNFLQEATPLESELVVEKMKSSAFSDTELMPALSRLNLNDIVIAGFTANECIDASAKDAAALGFSTYVVGDATAMFDMKDQNGKLMKAEKLHRATLLNIHALCAKVIQTQDIC